MALRSKASAALAWSVVAIFGAGAGWARGEDVDPQVAGGLAEMSMTGLSTGNSLEAWGVGFFTVSTDAPAGVPENVPAGDARDAVAGAAPLSTPLPSLTAMTQDDAATTRDATRVDASGDFVAGTEDVLVYGRYSSTAPFDRRNLYTVAASYGYYFWNRTSINPTVNLHYISHDGEDIVGADFSLTLRHHFWVYNRWSAFVEGDVGACFFDHRYPIGSSHFQFTAGGGVGMTYRIADQTYLLGGLRLDHYSNASIWGSDRHQSYNEVGVYLGVMWTF